jgi:hypothetical protein
MTVDRIALTVQAQPPIYAVVEGGDQPVVIIERQDALVVVVPGEQGLPGPQGEPEFAESGPLFTYAGGDLARIDYDSGNYKLFTHSAGALRTIDYVRAGQPTIRKTFNYDGSGNLTSIDQTTI